MDKDKWLRDRDGKILLPNEKKEAGTSWVVEAVVVTAIVTLIALLFYGC